MNASIWYCDICDRTINNKSKSKHIIFESHKHIENFIVIDKEHEFFKPEFHKIDYINKNCARDCYIKYFHTLKPKFMYNFELTNGEYVNGSVSDKKSKKLFE